MEYFRVVRKIESYDLNAKRDTDIGCTNKALDSSGMDLAPTAR